MIPYHRLFFLKIVYFIKFHITTARKKLNKLGEEQYKCDDNIEKNTQISSSDLQRKTMNKKNKSEQQAFPILHTAERARFKLFSL